MERKAIEQNRSVLIVGTDCPGSRYGRCFRWFGNSESPVSMAGTEVCSQCADSVQDPSASFTLVVLKGADATITVTGGSGVAGATNSPTSSSASSVSSLFDVIC